MPSWKPLPTMEELVSRHGFSFERHYTTTSDGYVLEHHRLISNKTSSRKVVVLNHGMLDSSNMWTLFTPRRSLGFYLAERDFDVWLLNTRGNAISRKHITLSDKSPHYWNHSWHEIGIYDLPASIEYILHLTGSKTVDFVGFSMGATTYFVLMSELSQYSKKIDRVVLLAPAVFDVDLSEMIPYTSYVIRTFQTVYWYAYSTGLIGGFEFKGSHCETDSTIEKILCSIIKRFTSHIQDQNMNQMEYGEAISYIYGTASSLSFLHYYQNKISEKFAKFDYGEEMNLGIYGDTIPPVYNLGNSKNPIAIFWSEADSLCAPKGIKKLISSLPNVSVDYRIPVPGFKHAAFFASKNTEHIVNERILEFLQIK